MNPAVVTALTIMVTFGASVGFTWVVRTWLEQRRVLDAPNDRSLHGHAMVTGGGIAPAAVLLLLWVCLQAVPQSPGAALLIPLIALTLLGFLDDVHNLEWRSKLVLQTVVAVCFVEVAGPFSSLDLFGWSLDAAWLRVVVSLVWIVGLVNIYNFMDGIDGLASGYGALCAGVLGIWFVILGAGGLALFMYGSMAACLGFLVWNWAPARIFLGDAGSMMLGGSLAAVSILGQRHADIPLSAFILLYGLFIGDTAYTLARRAWRGAPLWQAHREHLYQRAVGSGLSHAAVTGKALSISIIIGVLASLEMARVAPRLLWLALALLVLTLTMILIEKREVPSS